MLTGGGAQAVMQMMQSCCKYRWSFARSPAARLLLCGLVPNRPRTSTGLWPGCWGPLLCSSSYYFWSTWIPIKLKFMLLVP